ncbi:DegT/DnrJ/EryC1/StrS family aminotransferase, partial [Rhizobiaceae bacterium]|nr:DegT/DnrJ/EryC1/StrS family aminotransferase [Rhizobiaceae bacterium]
MMFTKSFTQQEPIDEATIEAAVAVLRSGRLHRYNTAPGEEAQTEALEREYAAWQGVPYCLAVTSGGQAMQIALRAAGVKPGDSVLTNAFTLAPVPGAIAAVGAVPLFIGTTPDLTIDLDDLAAKAVQGSVLMLSHMRGHIADMDALIGVLAANNMRLIEDCAHTMGATWNGVRSGNFGLAACFSTQTYKHINSGEGGFLTTADAKFAARATILSGSYMLHARHGAGPDAAAFAEARMEMPNCSARMDNLRAAILRPQLPKLDVNITRWRERHDALSEGLADTPLRLPKRDTRAVFVGSSFQFFLPESGPESGPDGGKAKAFVA